MNSARSFRSIFMVASCAAAALGCYMVSLRVASERAALEEVENRIVLAQRDMRILQTEIGTRGRLAQLERWNVRVLALSAPSADQFLNGGFELAKLTRPQDKVPIEAPVVLASAPAAETAKAPIGQPEVGDSADAPPPASGLLRTASLKLPEREVRPAARQQPDAGPAPNTIGPKSGLKKAAPSARAAESKPNSLASTTERDPKRVPAQSKPAAKKSTEKTVAHVAAKVTSAAKTAKADPLAPLAVSNGRKGHKDTVAAR